MGIFDFFKFKKSGQSNDILGQYKKSIFPKGEKDINAVTENVLYILNNNVSKEEARNIGVKSVVLSRVSKKFDEERLRDHLSGYCIHHFNDDQIKKFHSYLVILVVAAVMAHSPHQVNRSDDGGWAF